MKLLFTADSILQRDALQARLNHEGIVSLSPARDMSRKMTGTTVDLSLNGYSTQFDGFEIWVEDDDFVAAAPVLDEFQRETRDSFREVAQTPYWRRFYFCSIFSLMFPVLFTLLATYHLLQGLRQGPPPRGVPTLLAAIICYLLGAVFSAWIVRSIGQAF